MVSIENLDSEKLRRRSEELFEKKYSPEEPQRRIVRPSCQKQMRRAFVATSGLSLIEGGEGQEAENTKARLQRIQRNDQEESSNSIGTD